MTPRRPPRSLRRNLHRSLLRGLAAPRRHPLRTTVLQVGLLSLFWMAGQAIVAGTHWPIPGSVVGLALVLLLIRQGWLPASALAHGSRWLLAEMLLFFVPAVMALLNRWPLLRSEGLSLLLVILLGTVIVMAGSALTVDWVMRWDARRAR